MDSTKQQFHKKERLVIGPCSNHGVGISVVLDRVAVPLKKQAHSLGIVLDVVLLLHNHVTMVSMSSCYQLWFGTW